MLVKVKFRVAPLFGLVGALRVTVGGPRSIRMLPAVNAVVGPTLERESVRVLAFSCGAKVPSPHPETETVKLVPLEPLTLKEQFGALPEFRKSSDDSPATEDAKLSA